MDDDYDLRLRIVLNRALDIAAKEVEHQMFGGVTDDKRARERKKQWVIKATEQIKKEIGIVYEGPPIRI